MKILPVPRKTSEIHSDIFRSFLTEFPSFNLTLTIAGQDVTMHKLRRIRQSWPVLAILAFYVYLAFHALSGSQGLMSWADYRSDIDRLEAELDDARAFKTNLEAQITALRTDNLNRDALDLIAREKVFLSYPNEMTIWLDP